MAHLHCAHKRRVMVIPVNEDERGYQWLTLHRSNGSVCFLDTVSIGDRDYSPLEVLQGESTNRSHKSRKRRRRHD